MNAIRIIKLFINPQDTGCSSKNFFALTIIFSFDFKWQDFLRLF